MIKKPSVTELLKLLDKPALISWANKKGLEGIDISKKKLEWLSNGTDIHYQIEQFIRNQEPFNNKEDEDKFIAFISDKKILGYETFLETDWFTGRYDLLVEWNNKKYLVDFKRKHKRVYLEDKLQLVGYSLAIPCDAFCIVSVPDFTVMNIKIDNREPYVEILKSLSNIYINKQLL